MAEYLANLNNGKIDEKGMLRLFGTMVTQSGVIDSGSLLVAAQSTPDATVKIAGGATGHDVVFKTATGDLYHVWNTADKNVNIVANSSGVTKTDAIVAYADLAAGAGSGGTSNNPVGLSSWQSGDLAPIPATRQLVKSPLPSQAIHIWCWPMSRW